MRPVISATRAGSGGSPADPLSSAAGLSPGPGSASPAGSSCPLFRPGSRVRLAGAAVGGAAVRRGCLACCAGAGAGRRWPPAGRCRRPPPARRGRPGPAAGSSPGWLLAAGSSWPGPAPGSCPAVGGGQGPGVGDAGLAALGAGDGAGGLQRGQGVAGGGAADPGGVGDDGGGRAAGVGGQRGVDGRCRAAGGGAGTWCRGGVRRGVRRAAGGGRAGGGGVLLACHFGDSISFPAAFFNACVRCFLDDDRSAPGVKSSGECRNFWSSAETREDRACGTEFRVPGLRPQWPGEPFSPRGMPQPERVVAAQPGREPDRIPRLVKLN